MNKNENQAQQGDVILERVTKLPKGCKKIKMDNRGVVLAEGEVSGHYHGSTDSGIELLEAPDKKRYLVNSGTKSVSFKHQEHKPIHVPPGVWLDLGGVREYDYFQEMERKVVD